MAASLARQVPLKNLMRTLIQDFRYGIRILAKSPGFTLVAMLTLALGIGANTAIFSIVDAVLLRPLAMDRPDRVMLIQEVWQGRGSGGVAPGNFADIRELNKSFSSMAASASEAYNLATEDAPERIDGESYCGIFPYHRRPAAAGKILQRCGRYFRTQQRNHHQRRIVAHALPPGQRDSWQERSREWSSNDRGGSDAAALRSPAD
jgi:hypothetical protein